MSWDMCSEVYNHRGQGSANPIINEERSHCYFECRRDCDRRCSRLRDDQVVGCPQAVDRRHRLHQLVVSGPSRQRSVPWICIFRARSLW